MHPVRLMNTDTKILSIILVKRLEGILPGNVGEEQNGSFYYYFPILLEFKYSNSERNVGVG